MSLRSACARTWVAGGLVLVNAVSRPQKRRAGGVVRCEEESDTADANNPSQAVGVGVVLAIAGGHAASSAKWKQRPREIADGWLAALDYMVLRASGFKALQLQRTVNAFWLKASVGKAGAHRQGRLLEGKGAETEQGTQG